MYQAPNICPNLSAIFLIKLAKVQTDKPKEPNYGTKTELKGISSSL